MPLRIPHDKAYQRGSPAGSNHKRQHPDYRWSIAEHSGAQTQSADAQYASPTAPSDPAADARCTVSGYTDGRVKAGDVITCAGSFDIASGASVILQDADGTQGTFVDGQNATITEGSIVIDVSDDPINVSGGNGILNTDGLFVVATTGITATSDAGSDAGGSDDSGAAVAADTQEPQPATAASGVLPDTGGFAMFGALGALALVGTGFLVFSRRFSGQ